MTFTFGQIGGYGQPVNITAADRAAGGTPAQLAARKKFLEGATKKPEENPSFYNLVNESLGFDYKLRPDSSFSQENLDRFNRRQAEARQDFANLYGKAALKPITTYTSVEDIPRYTEEEVRQMNIEALKANPKSKFNRDKLPKGPAFGEGQG